MRRIHSLWASICSTRESSTSGCERRDDTGHDNQLNSTDSRLTLGRLRLWEQYCRHSKKAGTIPDPGKLRTGVTPEATKRVPVKKISPVVTGLMGINLPETASALPRRFGKFLRC